MDLPEVYDTIPSFDLNADLPLDAPEPGMVAIYALCDPRDGAIRYSGKTVNPRLRLCTHLKACNPLVLTHKDKWIRLLTRAGVRPLMRVLQWVSAIDWQTHECAAIAQAIRLGYALTNSTPGGDGVRGTAEVRAKISASLSGRKLAPERVARMSASHRGRKHKPHSEQTRRKMSEIAKAKGRRPSVQCIEASIRARTGRPASPKSVAHLIAYNKLPNPEKFAKIRQTRKVRGVSSKQRAASSKQMRTLVERRNEWEQARLQAIGSEQTRAKMSASQKRWLEDPAHAALLEERWARAQQAAWTPEARAKRSELLRQRWADPAYHAKVCQKMREVGRNAPPRIIGDETRAKLSAARKGKPASEETKARLCAAQKARRERERSTTEGRAQLSASADKTWAARRASAHEESTL